MIFEPNTLWKLPSITWLPILMGCLLCSWAGCRVNCWAMVATSCPVFNNWAISSNAEVFWIECLIMSTRLSKLCSTYGCLEFTNRRRLFAVTGICLAISRIDLFGNTYPVLSSFTRATKSRHLNKPETMTSCWAVKPAPCNPYIRRKDFSVRSYFSYRRMQTL